MSPIYLLIVLTTMSASTAQLMPRIEQNPMASVVVNVSDPVTLECRASGEPRPVISWYKDGQLLDIAKDNHYTLIRNSDLFIISARVGRNDRSDSATYYCKATNPHGQATSSNSSLLVTFLKDDFRVIPKSRQISAGMFLFVKIEPFFLVDFNLIIYSNAFKGSTVNMECKAPRGSPEPIIWWEKNSMPLQLSSENHVTYENGTFMLLNASLSDNGEYRCVAQNDAGIRRSASAFLNVFAKPTFLVRPETVKNEANSLVRFECQADGFPKPLIEWKKDGSIESIPLK